MIESEIKNLIIKAKEGDNNAFGQVYNEYLTPIYRYLYFRVGDKAMADDLAQDVFMKVFDSLDSFVVNSKSPLTYFYTVARNLLIDNYRKKKIPTINCDEAEDKLIEEDNPEKRAKLKEDILKLKASLKLISEDEADALTLKFLDNQSNLEISQIMGKSQDTVRQLQSRGLKSLRKFISKKDFF